MTRTTLYARRPILSAPLRWRVEFAMLSLLLAVIDRWAPSWAMAGPTILVLIAVLAVLIYPMMQSSDLTLLRPQRPRLERTIGVLCLVGLLATFVARIAADDFSSHDGFYLFLMGALLSRPPVLAIANHPAD
ncbi:hypothetical protein VM77_11015 [Citromicrobium sp. JL31]|jgi:FtsH-binding integral membrane protein|nr:hypothetical protein WG74_13590 [Citromicrobium sp. JL477]KPM12403.1 hypothetical protein VO58_14495 [Citromicrobium sp. JL1351]KPM16636.1 hypothetical protein VM77_11015 [Citromicrobium sp. JL31]KPM21194.1 hypothetical protein VO57_14920 [Citromicrobium sp. JL2201]